MRVVAECPCREEGRLACHRCLLPFCRGLGVENLSRLAAERHLRTILGLSADAEVPDGADLGWDVAAGPVVTQGAESHLELLFRTVLRERLSTLNATVREKPGPTGNILTVTLGRGRIWTVTPQQPVHGSMPDFVLRSNDPSVAPVAIFTDGWTFHASPQHNQVADDAVKRAALRAHGYVVLALTQADLSDKGAHVLAHDWLTSELVSALMRQPAGALRLWCHARRRRHPAARTPRLVAVVDRQPPRCRAAGTLRRCVAAVGGTGRRTPGSAMTSRPVPRWWRRC